MSAATLVGVAGIARAVGEFRQATGLRSSVAALDVFLLVAGEPGILAFAIGARIGMTTAGVSLLVETLMRSGLVEQRMKPGNRRDRPLYLTMRGEDLLGTMLGEGRAA